VGKIGKKITKDYVIAQVLATFYYLVDVLKIDRLWQN